jgi:hypothetical protein
MVLDNNMSGESDFIREDVVVANHAVVSDMTADHEKVARSYARRFAFAAGPVQRTKLTNLIIFADFEIALLAVEFYVLRLTAHDGVLENPVSGPEFRKPLYYGIGPDLTIRADFHVIFDDRCRMDRHLQGFEDNRVLWILQILFMMQPLLWGFD